MSDECIHKHKIMKQSHNMLDYLHLYCTQNYMLLLLIQLGSIFQSIHKKCNYWWADSRSFKNRNRTYREFSTLEWLIRMLCTWVGLTRRSIPDFQPDQCHNFVPFAHQFYVFLNTNWRTVDSQLTGFR